MKNTPYLYDLCRYCGDKIVKFNSHLQWTHVPNCTGRSYLTQCPRFITKNISAAPAQGAIIITQETKA